jgi:cytochrome c peroxidase
MSRSSKNSLGTAAIRLCLVLAFSAVTVPVTGYDLPVQFVVDPRGDEPITPIPPPPIADPLKLSLGERLFHDARLSGDQKRPCSACHDTSTNGADAVSRTVDHDGAGLTFNTSTVFNAALSFRLGWTGKFRSFETHAAAGLDQGGIMGTTIAEVLGRLNADAEIFREFREAYGRGPDRASLLDALATFERSLLTPGSRFDRWLGGDAAALSGEEMRGYRLFKSLGCISCHQGVNVGGNLFERQGIFHPLTSPNPGSLRVPSLRNVATTPPYFHDGSAPTLEDAVRRMAAAQINRTLSGPQIGAIVAFLHTLTGNYRGNPVVAASP